MARKHRSDFANIFIRTCALGDDDELAGRNVKEEDLVVFSLGLESGPVNVALEFCGSYPYSAFFEDQ